MADKDWRSYIYKVSAVILVIFFVTGVGFGAKNILSIEGTMELYTPPEPLSPKPETNEDVAQYINNTIEKALSLQPKTEYSAGFSINSGSVKISDDNEQITAAVKMALPELNRRVTADFVSETADFSESAESFLKPCEIDASHIESSVIDYKYYKCSLCTSEIKTENYSTVCPECKSENTLQLRSYDKYKITVRIKPDSESFFNNPFPKSETVEKAIADGSEEVYTLEKFDKKVTDVILYAEINRLSDKIEYLRFESVNGLTANLKMQGEYESLGSCTVMATANDSVVYKFTWPAVTLDKHEMTVEKGSSEVLKAKLTCDNPLDYEVTWSSSDESVLSVDSEGYLKTHKVFGDSIITASFVFNGKEYSDSCLVHVGVPVEGVDLNKGSLKLKKGETAELKPVFNPKDATNAKCYWFSENEAVATVDENGTVTAVNTGETVIYIISDYGNYYSSCKTEVTD